MDAPTAPWNFSDVSGRNFLFFDNEHTKSPKKQYRTYVLDLMSKVSKRLDATLDQSAVDDGAAAHIPLDVVLVAVGEAVVPCARLAVRSRTCLSGRAQWVP